MYSAYFFLIMLLLNLHCQMSVHWHTLFVMGNSIVLLFTILTSADSVFRTDTWVSVWQLVAESHEFLNS